MSVRYLREMLENMGCDPDDIRAEVGSMFLRVHPRVVERLYLVYESKATLGLLFFSAGCLVGVILGTLSMLM